jgi:imidazolonepropionase-like amidohydrolase
MAHRLVLGLLLFVFGTALVPAQSGDGAYVIRDVRVFDGEDVTERQTVVISDGTIAASGDSTIAVPSGAQEVAGQGRTLLPGLIDAHVHLPVFSSADALQQNLAFGVTTVVVMWAPPQLVSQLKQFEATNRPDVASVITAGTGATAPGGHPTQMDPQAARLTPTLRSPDEADAFVAARLAEGSDFIKIIYDDTNEAYGRTLPTLDDGLAHLFVGPTVSADFGEFAASRAVFVIPTLSVLYSVCGKPDGPSFLKEPETMKYVKPQFRGLIETPPAESKVSCAAAPHATRQLVAAKVPVLAGTDVPAPGATYGASLHKELEHLVDAGLTPMAALAAATSATAKAFRMTDRGRIKPGMRADVVLVDGDPSKQVRDTRNIVAIWKRGVRVQRAP